MNREEEITQAATKYCQDNIPSMQNMHLAISTAFEAGAEWADGHPSWNFITRLWNIATKTCIAQVNRDMSKFKSENEIEKYIKDKLGL